MKRRELWLDIRVGRDDKGAGEFIIFSLFLLTSEDSGGVESQLKIAVQAGPTAGGKTKTPRQSNATQRKLLELPMDRCAIRSASAFDICAVERHR
jgi:hypothetical protein